MDPATTPRPPLDGDDQVDVAIVGGGFSGLWTAYYLMTLDPTMRVAVVEREYCGYGASGRNGGWAVGELASPVAKYAKWSSHDQAMGLARAVFDTVDEIRRVSESEQIDCDYAKGGVIRVARTSPQADRQRAEIDQARAEGFTADEIRLLDANEARAMLNATQIRSGIFYQACAAIDPAKLVRGLAEAVERHGAVIYEQTPVVDINQGQVVTDRGTITAEVVVRATEGYTRDLPGHRRDLLPVYSFMIATEPLTPEVMAEVGLANRPTFSDDRHMVIYGQRTADDRIAFGGTGVPYLFGSGISAANETRLSTHERIHQILVDMLPAVAEAAITHRWGGVFGIPRNWVPGLNLDRVQGLASLGGYVGEGVAPSNLAGRTLAEMILGVDSERVSLPWVGAVAPKWEPEPLRWLGVRASRLILSMADEREAKTDSEARLAFRLSRLLRGA